MLTHLGFRAEGKQFCSFQPLDELPAGGVLALDAEQTIDVQIAVVTCAVDERLSPGRGQPHGNDISMRSVLFHSQSECLPGG